MFGDYLRDEQGKIIIDEDGFPVPQECGPHYGLTDVSKGTSPVRRVAVTRTRTPITSRFRRIGFSPAGVLGEIEKWWSSLSKEWRYGILGGIGVVAVITAALGKKEGKSSWLKKV